MSNMNNPLNKSRCINTRQTANLRMQIKEQELLLLQKDRANNVFVGTYRL